MMKEGTDMRKTTKKLREKLDEAALSDSNLASKLGKIVAYIENVERHSEERRAALIAEIGAYHEHQLGEQAVIRKMIDEVVRELRGDDEAKSEQQDGNVQPLNRKHA